MTHNGFPVFIGKRKREAEPGRALPVLGRELRGTKGWLVEFAGLRMVSQGEELYLLLLLGMSWRLLESTPKEAEAKPGPNRSHLGLEATLEHRGGLDSG